MPEREGFDLQILREIIKIMKENNINEVCIEQKGLKIQVKQGYVQPVHAEYGVPVPEQREKVVPLPSAPSDEFVLISAPMVGTFYRAPSPDTEPYVEVGSQVKAGQVICIIEAMKLMNEITADMDCEIVEILAKNGQSMEYGQAMFKVKPKA